MRKLKLLIFVLICLSTVIFANQDLKIYSKIFIPFNGAVTFETLNKFEVFVDHANRYKNGIETILNEEEVELLKTNKINFKVLVKDCTKHFQEINKLELKKPEVQNLIKKTNSTFGFGFGSHAGYYTPQEVENLLDTISLLYPNIASTKFEIGNTFEGKPIYAIKISDNVNSDESIIEPAVYIDAMHHAREPLSMSLAMYYLFWLVQNYGTDTVATHLVNNREHYFVPIVNVDGYQYNIDTNPNGGGLWRKTRSINVGSNCVGTDPNRNYGAGWGSFGASANPCNSTFHGDTLYSESETQAVNTLVKQINPTTALSIHSYSEIYIESDYPEDANEAFFADYSLDICAEQDFAYGVDDDLLYQTSGTTVNFLDSVGAISYTPEIGGTFWEPISQIFFYLEKHLPSCIYIANIAGEYPDIKSVELSEQNILPGLQYHLNIELMNKGLKHNANNIEIEVVNSSNNIIILNHKTTHTTLAQRSISFADGNPIIFSVDTNANVADTIFIELAVNCNGFTYETETQKWIVGETNILFEAEGSTGIIDFDTTSNSNQNWDTTYVLQRSGSECFTDSRLKQSENNTLSYITLKNVFDIKAVEHSYLEYWIAAGLSNFNTFSGNPANEDFAQLEISTDGINWTDIETENTTLIAGENCYVLNEKWKKEVVDLSDFNSQTVKFRFLISSSDASKPDGVFIDDIRVVNYSNTTCNYNNFPNYEIYKSTCAQGSDASIELLNDSLVNNYCFDWNNGSTGFNLENESNGNYFVTITDTLTSCSKTLYFNIEATDSLTETDSDQDGICDFNDLCNGYNDLFDLDQNGLSDYCDNCDSTKIITGVYNVSDTIKMSAINYIRSAAKILNNSEIKYTAGYFIELQENFETEMNTFFEAKIDSCSNY